MSQPHKPAGMPHDRPDGPAGGESAAAWAEGAGRLPPPGHPQPDPGATAQELRLIFGCLGVLMFVMVVLFAALAVRLADGVRTIPQIERLP